MDWESPKGSGDASEYLAHNSPTWCRSTGISSPKAGPQPATGRSSGASSEQLQAAPRPGTRNRNQLKGSAYTYVGPIAAFRPPRSTGRVYPLTLMVGEAPDEVKNSLPGATVAYSLIDITSPHTQKRYYGFGTRPGAAGHLRGDRSRLQELRRRMPPTAKASWPFASPSRPSVVADNHPGTEMKFYTSEEGIL